MELITTHLCECLVVGHWNHRDHIYVQHCNWAVCCEEIVCRFDLTLNHFSSGGEKKKKRNWGEWADASHLKALNRPVTSWKPLKWCQGPIIPVRWRWRWVGGKGGRTSQIYEALLAILKASCLEEKKDISISWTVASWVVDLEKRITLWKTNGIVSLQGLKRPQKHARMKWARKQCVWGIPSFLCRRILMDEVDRGRLCGLQTSEDQRGL